MRLVKSLTLFLLFFGSTLLSSCAYNPNTDTTQFNFVSVEEEKKIGAQAHSVILNDYGVYREIGVQDYVNKVGQRVISFVNDDSYEFVFTVLDSPIINAFALPGGYIYVTRGLLANLNSEAELAFVLGHEASHVLAKHGAQRLSQQTSLAVLGVLAEILLGESSKDTKSLVNAGVNLAVLGYGRENEFEADKLGVVYALKSQYQPESFTGFFHTLKAQEQYEPTFLEQLASSHPPTSERITRVESKIHEIVGSQNVTYYERNRQGYLSEIEGLIVGKASLQGILSDKEYQNPALGLFFPIAEDWSVSLADDDKKLLTFTHPKIKGDLQIYRISKEMTPKAFSRAFPVKGEREISVRKIGYYNKPAYQTVYSHLTDQAPDKIGVATYFIHEYYGFRFVFYINSEDYEGAQSDADKLIRTLTFEPSESQLVVYTVQKGETLESIAKDDEVLKRIQAYNGLKTKAVSAGDLIKLPSSVR